MKNGNGKYAFFTLEDHYGQIEFIVNSKKVEEYRDILAQGRAAAGHGTVDAPFGDGEAARERLRFNDAKLLSDIRRQKSSLLDIRLNADLVSDESLVALEKLLREHTGPVQDAASAWRSPSAASPCWTWATTTRSPRPTICSRASSNCSGRRSRSCGRKIRGKPNWSDGVDLIGSATFGAVFILAFSH